MHIEVSTDNNITGREGLTKRVASIVENALAHHQAHITRVEVHLSDENAAKPGVDDKRCVIEARLEGHRPLAASHNAGNIEDAVGEAADKLARQLTSTLGRLRDR